MFAKKQHLLLTLNQEHKKRFQDIFPEIFPIEGFRDGKDLKDYLVRAK